MTDLSKYSRSRRTPGLKTSLAASLAFWMCGSPLWADLKVEDLTSYAIPGVGPFYQDVDDAIRLFTNGDTAGALARLESAKKSTPRLPPPEIMLARMQFDGGQIAAGVATLEKAAQKLPQDPEAYLIMAERALAEGRLTEAGLLFDRAARLLEPYNENPRRKSNMQVRAYAGWAGAEEKAADWAGAQKRLEALLKLDSRNAQAHEALGRALYRQGKQKEAYTAFQSAAEYDKSVLPAELAMAGLAGDKAKAEQWLKVALQKSGQDLRTQLGAAQFLMSANQIPEALQHAEEALKLDPNGLEANSWAGVLARIAGDFKKAEKHLSAAHLMAPLDAGVINSLALVLLESSEKAKQLRALQFAEYNVRQNPNNTDLLATLGWVNFKLNRRAEAQRAFSLVMKATMSGAASMNADMAFYLANILKEQGKGAEAAKFLTEAINNNEPFAYRKQAQDMLAQISKGEKPSAKGASRAGAQRGATPSGAKLDEAKRDADPARSGK